MGEVCNASDSELWHTLIEADNYLRSSFWSISMQGKWIVSILIRQTIRESVIVFCEAAMQLEEAIPFSYNEGIEVFWKDLQAALQE